MSSAPVFGLKYMEVDPMTSPAKPPTKAEADILAAINDPVFTRVWNANKNSLPAEWQGNAAFIEATYQIANAYKFPPPAPTITSLTPNTGPHNTDISTLTIAGTGFDSGAIIYFGSAYVKPSGTPSPTSLSCQIGAVNVAQPGTIQVSVTNHDGQSSGQLPFTVT